MELGNNLRKFRLIDAEMTQQELADKIGVSRQTIHAIERSKFNPSIKLSLEIAHFFGVPVEDIFYLKEEKK
ncbi:MAG: transcriptional regulator [Candidatus Muiribacterium halophilum]|uniref:Transcriptional regulator n=1 Tax=Muiribacterium halophilum TaxID=2053465 RepID=A0A2N5ZKY2_MUIH1|nr:MAG: transcriptional regulator [Candidatus Muirbacterium halophilum]